MRRIAFFLVLLAATMSAYAQETQQFGFEAYQRATESSPQAGNEAVKLKIEADQRTVDDRREERNFKYKALLALSTTTAVLYVISIFVLIKLHEKPSARYIVNVTSLALIVYGALVLSLTSSTHEGLTATVGIFGALAGYLFGQAGQKAAAPEK